MEFGILRNDGVFFGNQQQIGRSVGENLAGIGVAWIEKPSHDRFGVDSFVMNLDGKVGFGRDYAFEIGGNQRGAHIPTKLFRRNQGDADGSVPIEIPRLAGGEKGEEIRQWICAPCRTGAKQRKRLPGRPLNLQ